MQLSDFRVESELGGTAFMLYRATHLATGRAVVLKTISVAVLKRSTDAEVAQVQAEFEIHAALKSPDIIPVLGQFYDRQNVYLVLESAPDGDLEAALARQPARRIDERRAALIVAAVARALRYCHAQGVAHRDVKPGNVLLGPGPRVRLADFGLAAKVSLIPHKSLTARVGTPDYVAPELLATGDEGYGSAVDMWALGVMLYELLVGRAPFFEDDMSETYQRIARADYAFPLDVPMSHEARSLIRALLQLDARNRPTPAAVLCSSFVLKYLGASAAVGKCNRNRGNLPRPSVRRRNSSFVSNNST